ncbi:ferric-dicitrate binding protein FerR (iron transport regulator) [Lewinella marina]|uniref:FecR family protein n=1 Tax=Neolewinella marina TaxID=438751 RepID=UPI0014307997|nr:FecR domain-containing protein [Neolewinella marina]NJB85261.1 ferric-dicitrate binding protein FerR (iron transport regulator) [Neolewinella marina]
MSLEQNDIDQLVTSYREDFTPDVERGLRQLHGRLKPARKMRALPRRRLLAVAAVALLVVVTAIALLTRDTLTYLTNETAELAEFQLPDGTALTLQRGSQVSYDATTYNLDARRLTLDGQAYFEVVPDAGRPFIVSNGHAALQVTGTAFNLRAQAEEMEVEVSEGTVVLRQSNESLPVAAMECALVKPGAPIEHRPAPHLNHHAWRTGVLQFDHTPIEEALAYLSDNWGISCEWENGRVCSYEVNTSYRGGDAVAVLKDIAQLGGIEVRSTGTDGKHFLLKGSCSQ